MRRIACCLCLALSLATARAPARAEVWKTAKAACQDGFGAHPVLPPNPEPGWRLHNREECAIDLFTLDPVGPAVGNIGTGSGFGGGMHIVWAPDANHQLTLKGLYSINSSYVGSGNYEIRFRPFRPIVIKTKNGRPGQTDLTQGTLDFNLVRFDMRTQDFYGLGPSTTLAGHAVYRQQQTWAGVNTFIPLPHVSGRPGIVGAHAELKYLRPITKGVTGTSLPSVNTRYGESGAPASTLQPDFVELGAGLSIRTPDSKPVLWEKHEAQVTYQHYFERDSKQFSFDRLEAWGNINFDLLISTAKPLPGGEKPRWSQPVSPDRPWWKNALCMPQALEHCLAGTVKFAGRVTTSYTGSHSSVPFYLQPTLGGADFDGNDTLRGLVDYRLRAPNRLLMQVDFDKPIAQLFVKGHPVGQYGFYTFFDAGNVSLTPGQLIDDGLRKDVGVGVSVSYQNKLVLRAYIAFGAGEGSHPNAKMANAF